MGGHGGRRRGARTLVATIASVALALAATACGSSGADTDAVAAPTTEAAPTTTTTAPPTTTTAAPTEEEVVVATVEAAWSMLKRVSAAPDPDHPELTQYLTGAQLEKTKAAMAEWASKNQAVRDGPNDRWEHRPVLVSLDGDTALVSDCAIDDTWLIQLDDTGSEVGLVNGDEVVEQWSIQLERSDDGWRVTNLERLNAWYSGDPGCTSEW